MRTRTGRTALNLFGSTCADRPLAEGARRRAVGAQPSCRYLLPQPAFHRRNLHFQKPTSRSFGPTSTGRAFLGQVTWKGLHGSNAAIGDYMSPNAIKTNRSLQPNFTPPAHHPGKL